MGTMVAVGGRDGPEHGVCDRVGVGPAVAITALAGGPGFVLLTLAHAAGWSFPSWGTFGAEVLFAVIQLALLAVLVACGGRRLDARAMAITRGPRPVRTPAVGEVIAMVLLPVVGFAVLPRLLGASVANGSTYGMVTDASLPLTLAMVLVRYPLTVLAEEALFRGWLQPRLTWAPPVLSGILWGGYHVFLQPLSTVPSLMCFGIALGLIRRWTGDIRATATIHYVLDAGFFLINYR
jgi:membrane protease YdiL (CAAX protease family)